MQIKKIDLSFLPPLLIIIVILGFSVLFNVSIIDVRLQELDRTLARIAYQQDLNKSLNMLAKYSIIKRRMERGYEDSEDYAIESKVMAVIASDFLRDPPRKLSAWNYVYPVVRIGINVIRLFMGKSIVSKAKEERDTRELEVAYFYERNRRYEKALAIYTSILKAKKHSPDIEAYIILHKGFCESMIGEMDKSRNSYERIITRFSDSETAVVAWKLLEFINTIDDELKEVKETTAKKKKGIAYGKQLYFLMDYKNAITVFSEMERKKESKAKMAEALFLKARCHEELGETALAVENYRELLKQYKDTKWAKEANRRIFILGEFYERDQQITQIALQRLKEYRDESFFKDLNFYSDIIEETKVSDKVRVKQREEVRKKITEQDANILDIIEGIDLTGEDAAKKEAADVQEIERLKKTRMMERAMLEVNLHPLRKASFLEREIRRKCKPLNRLYNQMLRSEKPFSGTLNLQFEIESSGKTRNVSITPDSDIMNQKFRNKVIEAVETWQFPKIEDKYTQPQIIRKYPVVFKEK